MLIAGILNGMGDKDLNQRYAGCYVLYGGKIVYVKEFNHPFIFMISVGDGKEISEPFNYKLLDTSRPRSRWYVAQRGKYGMRYCVHVSFPPKKQYHRGLCGENIVTKFTGRAFGGEMLFTTLLTEGFAPINTKRLELGEEGVFKDHILVRRDADLPDRYVVMYRTKLIASYSKEEKKLVLFFPRFKQEIEEAVVGADKMEVELAAPHPNVPEPLRPYIGPGLDDLVRRERRNWMAEYYAGYFIAKRRYEQLVHDMERDNAGA